jgi:hypothetical protein
MSRTNAQKKAERKALGLPKPIDEDVNPYEEPKRCQNCGAWVMTMIFKGTGVCGENCRKAMEERKARREAKQGSSTDADGGSLGAEVDVHKGSGRLRHSA